MALSACATFEGEPEARPGVREARACMKTLLSGGVITEGFIVRACTNTGVWMVDQVDPHGGLISRYDFVNRDYADPATGGGLVSVDSLDTAAAATFAQMQKDLNRRLLEQAGS
jgi:hypothetical protein